MSRTESVRRRDLRMAMGVLVLAAIAVLAPHVRVGSGQPAPAERAGRIVRLAGSTSSRPTAPVHGTLAAAPPRFESIALEVRGQSADQATFDKLIQIAERGCIVLNTLAGTVRVEVKRM